MYTRESVFNSYFQVDECVMNCCLYGRLEYRFFNVKYSNVNESLPKSADLEEKCVTLYKQSTDQSIHTNTCLCMVNRLLFRGNCTTKIYMYFYTALNITSTLNPVVNTHCSLVSNGAFYIESSLPKIIDKETRSTKKKNIDSV